MRLIISLLLVQLSLLASVSVGEKAPNFSLKSLTGKSENSINNLKGRVVLLNIWASWCGGCKKEMPALIKLQNEYRTSFQTVTVNIDKDAQSSLEFLHDIEKKVGLNSHFINLHDPKKIVPNAYNCIGMPSSYLIDRDGVVRAIFTGSLDEDDIKALTQEIKQVTQQ